jgi:CRP-like cAMP-binding protein
MLTTIEKMLRLQDIRLLRDLPTDALAQLASLAEERRLDEGEPLWQPGSHADDLYFLLEGVVVILDHKGAPEIAVTPGSDLGAGSLLSAGTPRSTAATVLRPALLLRVKREDFLEVLSEHPEATRALLDSLGSRLAGDTRRLDAGDAALPL